MRAILSADPENYSKFVSDFLKRYGVDPNNEEDSNQIIMQAKLNPDQFMSDILKVKEFQKNSPDDMLLTKFVKLIQSKKGRALLALISIVLPSGWAIYRFVEEGSKASADFRTFLPLILGMTAAVIIMSKQKSYSKEIASRHEKYTSEGTKISKSIYGFYVDKEKQKDNDVKNDPDDEEKQLGEKQKKSR